MKIVYTFFIKLPLIALVAHASRLRSLAAPARGHLDRAHRLARLRLRDLERAEGERSVGDGFREAEVLVLGPELHLAGLLAAHLVHLVDRVLLQVVVAIGVVEDAGLSEHSGI